MAFQVISKNYLSVLISTEITEFLKIPLHWFGLGWASVFPSDLALYLKDLKLSVLAISALKSVASSFEQSYKLPVVSE